MGRHGEKLEGMRFLGPPVRDVDIESCKTISDIADAMAECGGFVAPQFARAVSLLAEMFSDDSVTVFLSSPAAPFATGLRGVYRALVKRKLVDVLVLASGALDHDIARSWANYYSGTFLADDVELEKVGIHRLGSVFIPKDNYGPLLESKLQPLLEELWKEGVRELSPSELCKYVGERVVGEDSVLYWAAKNGVKVFVPGFLDGAVGSQVWSFSKKAGLKLDELKDEDALADIVFSAKKSGALIIGGGISKHHTIWWNQFRGGLDYAIQVTTAVEWDGSLSGAQTREAITWGKVKPEAKHVTVYGEATLVLPFLVRSAMEKAGLL